MFDKKFQKITHLGDAPPFLCPLKCLTRPGARHITPLLAGARYSSSMGKWPRHFLSLPLFTNVVEGKFSEVRGGKPPKGVGMGVGAPHNTVRPSGNGRGE